MDALVAGGMFFVVARGFTAVKGVDASVTTQVLVSGVLVGSVGVVGLGGEMTPAVKAMTAGTLFAETMYALGNDAVVTHAVLGTLATYGAGLLLAVEETNDEEETNEHRPESVASGGDWSRTDIPGL